MFAWQHNYIPGEPMLNDIKIASPSKTSKLSIQMETHDGEILHAN